MSEIRAVVFDMGKVLVDYDFLRFFNVLKQYGVRVSTYRELFVEVDEPQLETGEISIDEFLRRVQTMLSQPAPKEVLLRAWTEIFLGLRPEMIGLAQRLRGPYSVYILSNLSEPHHHYVESNYQLSTLVDGFIGSWSTGVMKPNPAIYRLAEERFGFEPQHAVFIDDLEPNIRAAEERGWKGVHHRSDQETVRGLELLGLKLR